MTIHGRRGARHSSRPPSPNPSRSPSPPALAAASASTVAISNIALFASPLTTGSTTLAASRLLLCSSLWLLLLLSLPSCLPTAAAWGREGHEIVGNIAYYRLSETTRRAVDSILLPPRGEVDTSKNGTKKKDDALDLTPLSHVANWADVVRFTKEYAWSFPLHFVDVQDGTVAGGCPCVRGFVGPGGGGTASYSPNSSTSGASHSPSGRSSGRSSSAAVGPVGPLAGPTGGRVELAEGAAAAAGVCTKTPTCRFVYERDCVDDMCAVGGIVNYTHRLMTYGRPQDNPRRGDNVNAHGLRRGASRHQVLRASRFVDRARAGDDNWPAREALMFLTHLVGDIHQPLHSSRASDKGGNTIRVHLNQTTTQIGGVPLRRSYPDRGGDGGIRRGHAHEGYNLHSIWDVSIIDHAIVHLYNSSQMAFQDSILDLIGDAERSGLVDLWTRCVNDGLDHDCSSSWAEESFDDALRWAYGDENGREIVDGTTLSEAYLTSRVHVVTRRLAAAAVRLALTLEVALGGGGDGAGNGNGMGGTMKVE